VPVTLTIPPPVDLTGGQPVLLGPVLNAALSIQGAIAPSEITTIHGGFNSFGLFGERVYPETTFTLDSHGRVPTSLNGDRGTYQWQTRASALHVGNPDQCHRPL
jgi:hypothetical protein